MNTLNASNSVGIDLGIPNYIHTSDGKTVDWLDLEDEYDRLRREQRKLSRTENGSNNYEKQRLKVAKVKRHIRRKVLDYQHKIIPVDVSPDTFSRERLAEKYQKLRRPVYDVARP